MLVTQSLVAPTLAHEDQGPFSLFVFHLPPEADDIALRALFEPFGYVESVKVVRGKGFGFVNFER
jgi:RNA recognition motif-containing protein